MSVGSFCERRVLDYLLWRPGATVQQVAEHFALAGSTAGSICARLLDKRLLTRSRAESRQRGRPAEVYRPALPGLVAAVIGNLLVRTGRRCEELALLAIAANALRTRRGALSSSVLPWISEKLPMALRRRLNVPARVVDATKLMAEAQHLDDGSVESMLRFHVGDGVSGHAMVFGRPSAGRNRLAGELGHVKPAVPAQYAERFAADDGPRDWRSPAVLGQQRRMQVDATAGHGRQHVGADLLAERDHHPHGRPLRAQVLDDGRIVNVRHRHDG